MDIKQKLSLNFSNDGGIRFSYISIGKDICFI